MQSNNTTAETPKLKLKSTVTITDTVDVDIDLPYFCKYGGSYTKVISEDRIVTVDDYWFSKSIEIGLFAHHKQVIAKGNPISEDEFNQAYQTVLSKIQNQTL